MWETSRLLICCKKNISGVLQLDSIMSREMKKKVKSEYIRRVKKLLRSQLHGENFIAGINPWALVIIRYGAGVLD